MILKSLLVGSMAAVLAAAVTLDVPLPTKADYESDMLTGVSPKPTRAPSMRFEVKRQAVAAGTDTCGWEGFINAVECPNDNECVAVSLGGTFYQGCCPDFGQCIFPTVCYDYNAYTAGSCVSGCQQNSRQIICSDSIDAYCQSFTFTNGAVGFGCNEDPASTYTPVLPTFNNLVASIRSTSGGAATGTAAAVASAAPVTNVATIVPAVILCVVYGVWWFVGIVVLIVCCQRHRRTLEAWDQQARAAEIAHYQQAAAAATGYVPPPPVADFYAHKGDSEGSVAGPPPLPVSAAYAYIPPAGAPPPMYPQAPGTPTLHYPYQPSPVGTPSPANGYHQQGYS